MSTIPAAPPRSHVASLQGADQPDAMVAQMRRLVGRNASRWKRLRVLEAAGLALSAPLAYLWSAFLLDNAIHLPVWGRLLAALGLVALVLVLGVRLVRRMRDLRLSEDEVALAIERQTPGGVQNRLINALQLARGAGIGGDGLAPAVVRENYANLSAATLSAAVPGRPALLRAGLAALLVGVGLAFWALSPEHFSNAASRILMPLADVAPIYRTYFEVQEGDIEGEGDVTIHVRILKGHPQSLIVTRTQHGTTASETIAVPEEASEVAYTFGAVRESLSYTIRGGDYTTPVYRIDVPAFVHLSLVRATLHHPAYTGRAPTHFERGGGDLEALRGSRAELTFVFDHPVSEAVLRLERLAGRGNRATVSSVPLELPSATEARGELDFEDAVAYELVVRQGDREPQVLGPFTVHVLDDQSPKLTLSGLDRQGEVTVDAAVTLRVDATDDIGLEKVGLFFRRAGDEAWKDIIIWPAERRTELSRTHDLLLAALGAAEGDALELVLRAVDTDPRKKGEWVTGVPQKIVVGGFGVALQRQYEQLLQSEAQLKTVLAAQDQAAEKTVALMQKLDPASGLRWDDVKTVEGLHTVTAELARAQETLRQTAGRVAREMPAQAGNLRVSVGMLADTEMIRAIRVLQSVPGRDGPQAKRAALADARLTQERTARSLREVVEHFIELRHDWELANMIAFVEMLSERQLRLRDQSRRHAQAPPAEPLRGSMKNRQVKMLDLVKLTVPAFAGLAERTRPVEPILADGFGAAATALGAAPLHAMLGRAAEEAGAGQWSQTATTQDAAAKELAAVFARLKKAQGDAALKALEALKQRARSDLEAQKELEKLQAGSTEKFTELKDKMKLEDILHMREAGGGKADPNAKGYVNDYLLPESYKASLSPPDSGKRQQFDILKLADAPGKTPSFPKQSDRTANKIGNPPIQEKFDDLVGKLLEEADEMQKKYETYNLNAAFNINEPGDIGKQAGDLNSTAASAATGNQKPPTVNVGGASRAGRRGARAHGLVVGEESINRRGRDKVQEGQEKASDQAGTIRERKSGDWQKDTSTGVGGKKVEGDNEVKFSLEDAGKWSDDIAKRLGKPQEKNFIVERKDGRLDPRVAEMLRDMTSHQEQLIERVKAVRKELRNLYLPTDHVDEVLAKLMSNLEALKDEPSPDLFRQQAQALDQLRSTMRVLQGPTSGFQPSLPRERTLHGRTVDEPAREALPGYEEAVKRYYERLAGQ